MPKFRKKPVVIEAYQWTKVEQYPAGRERDVNFYSPAVFDSQSKCKHCGDIMDNHGWIDTLEGGHIVCPNDWVITGIVGEKYPCKPDIFEATYEPVED